jgi:excisionase family DNA binding protein
VSKLELTTTEAARKAGIRLDSFYQLVRAGRLAARKVDGRWLIEAASLADHIAKRSQRKGQQ